jgi:hypothetical protein
MQSFRYLIGFSYEKICRTAGIHVDNVFFWINPVEKCTLYFPQCYINRGKVTSWRLLGDAFVAPSMKQVPHWCIASCNNIAICRLVAIITSFYFWLAFASCENALKSITKGPDVHCIIIYIMCVTFYSMVAILDEWESWSSKGTFL